MNQSLPRIIKEYAIYLKTIKGRSMNTIDGYIYDVLLFFKFLLQEEKKGTISTIKDEILSLYVTREKIETITLEDLYAFLYFCEEERKNSAVTRSRKISSLQSFFDYIVQKRKWAMVHPSKELEIPKKAKRQPIYLNMEETKEIIKVAGQYAHPYRNTAIITIMLHTGIRVSECAQLNIQSIQDNMVRIIGKGDKERTIYLNETCQKAFTDYIEKERKFIKNAKESDALFLSQFGKRIHVRTIQLMIKRIASTCSFYKKITPHKLRHTAATLLYQNGADIRGLQQLLGHESISTTQIYTHVEEEQIEKIVKNHPLNN